jgi:chitodextrinase
MSKYIEDKKKIVSLGISYVFCVLLILLTAGCGDHSTAPATDDITPTDDSRTGSASFSVQWQTDETDTASTDATPRYAIENCSAVGIAVITCMVYDASNNLIASGGPWDCEDHSAYMERVPAGSDLTFTILGWDTADGNIIYQGSTSSDVNIIAGEKTDAGTITAAPFVPTSLVASAVPTNRIDLNWDDQGATGYRVYQDGVMVATPTSPPFGIIDLVPNTQYCYTVSAVDDYGNESGQSNEVCATTGDTQAPSTPTELNAVAISSSQIDISWGASNDDVGVAGYHVYRDGELVGTTPTLTYSDTGLISNTEYAFTVAAYDEADNQSPETSPVYIMTRQSFVWYRDGDEDGYGDENATPINSETQPLGYVSDNTDCNDEQGSINPGATEECNQIDDNCDKSVDEGLTFDRDGDGFTSVGSCQGSADDCNDLIESINPDADEVCNDRIDNNCNDLIDEDCPIEVNIDNETEFKYVNQGPTGLSWEATVGDSLSQTPFEKLIEPPFDDLYPNLQYAAHYGYLEIGNSQDNIISYILVEIFTSNEESMRYELFIDSNNNENLTDDDGPHANQDTDILFAAQVSMNADIIATSGNTIIRPYQIRLRYQQNPTPENGITYYAMCHYAGEVLIGGDSYPAVAFERSNHDALYRESGLYIDLNRDGRLDVETEHFMDQTIVPMGGRKYELSLNYP